MARSHAQIVVVSHVRAFPAASGPFQLPSWHATAVQGRHRSSGHVCRSALARRRCYALSYATVPARSQPVASAFRLRKLGRRIQIKDRVDSCRRVSTRCKTAEGTVPSYRCLGTALSVHAPPTPPPISRTHVSVVVGSVAFRRFDLVARRRVLMGHCPSTIHRPLPCPPSPALRLCTTTLKAITFKRRCSSWERVFEGAQALDQLGLTSSLRPHALHPTGVRASIEMALRWASRAPLV